MTSSYNRRPHAIMAVALFIIFLGGCSTALDTVCISGLRTQSHLVESQSDQLRNLLIREVELLAGGTPAAARDAALAANRDFQSAASLITQFWNTAPASTMGDAASMAERVQLDRQRLQSAQSTHESAIMAYLAALPVQDVSRQALVTSRDNVRDVTTRVQQAMTSTGDIAGACR